MDEFEKRMHVSSFISTLCDTVTKMNPNTLLGEDMQKGLEAAGLKDKMNQAINKYLDMLMHFMEKADTLGSKYPIEEILGIKVEPKV